MKKAKEHIAYIRIEGESIEKWTASNTRGVISVAT